MGEISAAVAERLSSAARRLRAARREALAAVAVEETEWEYAGRTWSWPAGEAMTYFRDLAPAERAVLNDATADHGYEVVGVGTGRVAVALPGGDGTAPRVAKLARWGPSAEMGDGRPQNRRERAVWDAASTHPFLPVRAASDDGDWLVMPRAQVPPPEPGRAVAVVRDALSDHRDRFHFDELKPENVGAYRGRWWVVDYGRPTGEPLFVAPPESGDSAE